MFSSAEEVLRFIAEENVEFVDVRFCDLPGTMQHFTVPTTTGFSSGCRRRKASRQLADSCSRRLVLTSMATARFRV